MICWYLLAKTDGLQTLSNLPLEYLSASWIEENLRGRIGLVQPTNSCLYTSTSALWLLISSLAWLDGLLIYCSSATFAILKFCSSRTSTGGETGLTLFSSTILQSWLWWPTRLPRWESARSGDLDELLCSREENSRLRGCIQITFGRCAELNYM